MLERIRPRPSWPGWLAGLLPAGAAALALTYELTYQFGLHPERPWRLFWVETLLFALIGPFVGWLLLRRLSRDAVAGRLAEGQLAELRLQEQHLAEVIARSVDAVIGLDPGGLIVTWNHGAEATLGYGREEAMGLSLRSLFPAGPEGQASFDRLTGELSISGAVRGHEVTARARDGREIPVEVTYTPARDAAGRPLGGAVILRDVSERKTAAAEAQLRTQELTALYGVTTAVNQALTIEDALQGALREVLSLFQLEAGRVFLTDPDGGDLHLAAAQGDPDLVDAAEPSVAAGECLCGLALAEGNMLLAVDAGDDPRVNREGCRRHSHYACAVVPLLAKDRRLGVLHVASRRSGALAEGELALLRSVGAQVGTAIENMRLREDARRAEALATLLQEMHHRIKNNLQTVADLLSLEMSASPSPEAHKSLRDSVGRIKSIAAVHELLSVEQLRLTDITELARHVCGTAFLHLAHPGHALEAVIEGPPIYLPSKQATALALVLNELASNALEHAFQPSHAGGRLEIVLAQEGPQVTVTVSDDGPGLPPGFDLNRSRGLGLQIVRTLVEKDLAGTLKLENRPEGGSRVTMAFFK